MIYPIIFRIFATYLLRDLNNSSEAVTRKKKAQEKQEEQRQQLAEQIPTDRPYISIAEAVVLFGISRDTIYRQIRKGNIPAFDLGSD